MRSGITHSEIAANPSATTVMPGHPAAQCRALVRPRLSTAAVFAGGTLDILASGRLGA
jgi:hypothetical protein